MKTDEWVESCKQAYAVRRIMFGDCNKYHRCPDSHCNGRLNYEYDDMLQFCTECGTLVLPYKMKWVNPEYIKFVLTKKIHWKIHDFKFCVFWWLSDRYGHEEVLKYYDPWERRRKRVERKNKKRKEYEDVSVNELMDSGNDE